MKVEMSFNNKNQKVSLLIICFNQQSYIEEAIQSALIQQYSPLEIIISDDCSTDNTYKLASSMVEKYSGEHEIILHRNEKNLGLAGNINSAVRLASGEILCWAAGDDISLPGKVDIFAHELSRDSSLVGVHSYVNEIDENGKFIRLRCPSVPKLINSPENVVSDSIEVISQSHAFRRVVFEKFGPLSDDVTNESAVMAFREVCLGGIALVEKPLTAYRVGVGVSTIRGKTVEQLAVCEPKKYAGWWFSAFRQILRDAQKIGSNQELVSLIGNKLDQYRLIYEVNAKKLNLRALFESLLVGNFLHCAKAFIRRNSPRFILSFIYRQRGWI